MTIVWPCLWSSEKSASTSWPVCESRAPVGSSARSSDGTVGESAGDRDALPLASGKRGREDPCLFGNPDLFEKRHGALAPFSLPDARVEHRQLDVALHRSLRQQVVLLEDEADLLVADVRELGAREAVHALAVERVGSARRRVEAAEDRHERRLAGADGPISATNSPRANLHVDAPQGVNGDAIGAVCLLQFCVLDDVHGASRCRRPSRPSSSSGPRAPPAGRASGPRGSRRARASRLRRRRGPRRSNPSSGRTAR